MNIHEYQGKSLLKGFGVAIQEGIVADTPEQAVEAAKQLNIKAINQKDALKYETPNAKLGFLAQILEFDLKPSFVKERNEIVSNISKEEVNALAKKHLNTKDMIYLVVGDAKTLRPELEKLGMKVVDYSL